MTPVVAVIGGGAAGLMAAIHAAGPGRRVVLLERTPDGGRKILVSGGGRCNVLPSVLDEERYVTASSRPLMKKLLRAWPLAEQRRFFEEDLGLPLVREEETGKLFPLADKARVVRDALRDTAARRGVEWQGHSLVGDLQRDGTRWRIAVEGRAPLVADAVILTTGGLSVPQTGSDGFAYPVLARLGHTVHPTYPALTPLTLAPPRYADLAGVSLPVIIRAVHGEERRVHRGAFLFTHRGYSGPVVLDASDVAVRSARAGGDAAQLVVSWGGIDEEGWEERLRPGPATVGSVVRQALPTRLADHLLAEAGVEPATVLAQLTRDRRLALRGRLGRYLLPWTGDEGYRKAEVTGGGIALHEVDPRTMESRLAPGLFLAGELLDAFGPIGGYNFVWAWTTGRQAGRGVAQVLSNPRTST